MNYDACNIITEKYARELIKFRRGLCVLNKNKCH